jgi:PRELI-like family
MERIPSLKKRVGIESGACFFIDVEVENDVLKVATAFRMVTNIGKHAQETTPYCHPSCEDYETLLPIIPLRVCFCSSFIGKYPLTPEHSDSWSIVTLAFFLRYPNPYASHVISCDVISRDQTPSGSLVTTRLILKQGAMPRWFPKGIVSRAESWVVEESEVDPHGKLVRCVTKNLDHVKVMQVEESVQFAQTLEGFVLV